MNTVPYFVCIRRLLRGFPLLINVDFVETDVGNTEVKCIVFKAKNFKAIEEVN